MGTYDLDDAQLLAANVNGDNVVDQYDYMLVKRAVMGTYTIG